MLYLPDSALLNVLYRSFDVVDFEVKMIYCSVFVLFEEPGFFSAGDKNLSFELSRLIDIVCTPWSDCRVDQLA